MHKFTNTLTPGQVYRYALDFCQPHLRFRTVGKVTGEVILSILFAAAARMSSIHETCGRLAKAPCEETFTGALYP
jgi:putative transposase